MRPLCYIISGLCKIKLSLLFIHAPKFSLLLIFSARVTHGVSRHSCDKRRYVASLTSLQGPVLNPDGSNFINCAVLLHDILPLW